MTKTILLLLDPNKSVQQKNKKKEIKIFDMTETEVKITLEQEAVI